MARKQNTNLQVYKSFDIAELDRQDAQVAATSTVGADFMKLTPGKNVVRFLPLSAADTRKSPFAVVNEHFFERPDGTRVRFACPRLMESEPCPVCKEADRLRRTGNPIDREQAFELYPRLRVYANVIDRQQPESGPRILAFGKTIWEGLKKIRKDSDEGGDFTDPSEDGFDIIVRREGTGKMDTKYTVQPARNDSELADLGVIDRQWDLDKYTHVPKLSEVQSWMGAPPPRVDSAGVQLREDAEEVIVEAVFNAPDDQRKRLSAGKRKSKKPRKAKSRKTKAKSSVEDAAYDSDDGLDEFDD